MALQGIANSLGMTPPLSHSASHDLISIAMAGGSMESALGALTGYDETIYRNTQLENALSKPDEYMQKRTAALRMAINGDKLDATSGAWTKGKGLETEYKRLLAEITGKNPDIPTARAQAMAATMLRNYVATQEALIEERFPSTFVRQAAKKKLKKNVRDITL